MKTLYHRTTADAAASILAYGFRDGDPRGILVSDQPFDGPEDAPEERTLLAVDFDGNVDELLGNEWIERDKPGRVWFLPAVWLNARCRVRMVEVGRV
jgi:hypothetical protein